MLHTETVAVEVLELTKSLQKKDYLEDFFLVGGNALALQLGHRKSVDIDLFTLNDFSQEALLQKLENDFSLELDMIENNTIRGTINGIKVDMLTHKQSLIEPVKESGGIRLVSIRDIAAMKLNAISLDGTRIKDFIDVYFLLDQLSVEELLDSYKNKYKLRNSMHALKSLQYFEDADIAEWPVIIKEEGLTWKQVTKKIDKACKDFFRSL